MNQIPPKLKDALNKDPYMKQCCLDDKVPVQFHHTIIYKNSQLQEKWAIVPACHDCHKGKLPELKLVALNRATDEELEAISKVIDYKALRDRLNEGEI